MFTRSAMMFSGGSRAVPVLKRAFSSPAFRSLENQPARHFSTKSYNEEPLPKSLMDPEVLKAASAVPKADNPALVEHMLSSYPSYSYHGSMPTDRSSYLSKSMELSAATEPTSDDYSSARSNLRPAYKKADESIPETVLGTGLPPLGQALLASQLRQQHLKETRSADPNQRLSDAFDLGDVMWRKPPPEEFVESALAKHGGDAEKARDEILKKASKTNPIVNKAAGLE